MPRSAKPDYDPHSERVVLIHGGSEEAHISGVPGRDLTEHDVCRLAFIREAEPAAVVADLIASGLYAPAKPEG